MKIILDKILEEDYKLILKWRNDSEMMKGFYSQKDGHIISWDEHITWIRSRNKDFQWQMIISGEDADSMRKIGVVIVRQLDYWEPEIAVFIGEKSFWGKGIAQEVLRQIFEMLRSKGYEYVRDTILNTNQASINLSKKLGFQRVGDARPGESLYRLKL